MESLCNKTDDFHVRPCVSLYRRCMNVLGYDEYLEGHTDGLQILRYNLTNAYIPHMDYLTDRSGKEKFDYESSKKGGNRYATILLYMNDLDEGTGGETVFPKAWPTDLPVEKRIPLDQVRVSLARRIDRLSI